MIQVTENIDFEERLNKLQLGFSNNIAILPQNFFSETNAKEVFYNEELKTIQKMFSANGIEDIYCQPQLGSIEFKAQKSSEIILPTLLISGLAFTQNSHLISISLNILSNYAYNMLKGIPKRKQKVKMDLVVEKTKNKTFTKISFEGDPEGLKNLPEIISKINKQ